MGIRCPECRVATLTVWGTGGCSSWYLDRNGAPLVNPILLDDLAADMDTPIDADFVASPLAGAR